MSGSLLLHATSFIVVLEGSIVAESCMLSPMAMRASVRSMLMPVGKTVLFLTVTWQVAIWPEVVLTVIRAVPALLAVTRPLEFTEAMLLLLLDQVSESVVPSGSTVAVSICVIPTSSVNSFTSRLTEVDGSFTVTVQLPDMPPAVVAVMVVEPTLCPVTTPFSTVATLASPVCHVSSAALLDGVNVTVTCLLSPTLTLRLLRLTLVTSAGSTTTSQEPVAPDSASSTVIVTLPVFIAVTLPFESTVATDVSLLRHIWPCGSSGSMSVVRFKDSFAFTPYEACEKLTVSRVS